MEIVGLKIVYMVEIVMKLGLVVHIIILLVSKFLVQPVVIDYFASHYNHSAIDSPPLYTNPILQRLPIMVHALH